MGQEKIHEKSNEILVFQEMLDNLNVKGKTVTADAMHCQKETCRKIIEWGDYLFELKGNQGTLHNDVTLFFENTPSSYFRHAGEERRTVGISEMSENDAVAKRRMAGLRH